MFDINNYPNILTHLQNSSSIGVASHNSQLFPYSMICPYCNDGYRKEQSLITHGHLFIAKTIPYFKCFLCNESGHINKLLKNLGFTDFKTLSEISKNTNYKFTSSDNTVNYNIQRSNILYFLQNHFELYQIYLNYIINKFGEIDLNYFKLFPNIYNGDLFINYVNYDNVLFTSVKIHGNSYNKRFMKPNYTSYYYFQNPILLHEVKDIVLTEGASDLINMYNYGGLTKHSFYICNSGKNYNGLLIYLIKKYITIRKVNIHIILDSDVKYLSNIVDKIKKTCLNYNQKISMFFYQARSKDVSNVMDYFPLSV